MPTARARRLCPHAVFLSPNFDLYRTYSRRFREVLDSCSPTVEAIALDEAFLDVSGAGRLLGPGAVIAGEIRRRVHAELGLGASVGVASTKLVAKLASEAAKPGVGPSGPEPGLGVKVVAPGDEPTFLHPLPVAALPGVGPATGERLERSGVRTVGDLAGMPEAAIVAALGSAAGHGLWALARGLDDRVVVADRPPKSVGHEETYSVDHHSREPLQRQLVRLCEITASRLRDRGLAARTVAIKVRFADFRTLTRSRTLTEPVDTGRELAATAGDLLGSVDPTPGIRLLGVSGTNLVDVPGDDGCGPESAPVQLAFGEGLARQSSARSWRDVTRAVDEVRRRFGQEAVGPVIEPAPGMDGGLVGKKPS